MKTSLIKNIRHVLLTLLVLSLAAVSFSFLVQQKVRIHLIGDSTMADKPLADNPERGWGQMLPMFFNDNVEIFNYARNGRSTKSFIDEGRWKIVYDNLKPGDYVLIQFGHNDEKLSDSTRYTDPKTAFKANLKKFVEESRKKGAIPVLITPANRRKFDADDKLVDTHKDYAASVREVAKEENVSLIDLFERSRLLFNKLGSEKTKKIFLWIAPGKYAELPKGKEDNTHFQQAGAIEIANLVADQIRKTNLPIKDYLFPTKLLQSIIKNGENKIISLDYYFNNEHEKDKDGNERRYHYVWEDTANSGYSRLGGILTNLNAGLSELTVPPIKKNLDSISIYIIVDPDTPQENPNPNYINDTSIANIVSWVKKGGVLVLFGNDKGNCEFEHLNKLAANFGIHFNEDSRNRVTGKNFDLGKFGKLPGHPLFNGVKQIYLKEISTLKVQKPAESVLTNNGDVIMASAMYGKGFVFAVGDPWLYNEYIDNRKLPEDFENYKAAKNLFYWLLSKAKKNNSN